MEPPWDIEPIATTLRRLSNAAGVPETTSPADGFAQSLSHMLEHIEDIDEMAAYIDEDFEEKLYTIRAILECLLTPSDRVSVLGWAMTSALLEAAEEAERPIWITDEALAALAKHSHRHSTTVDEVPDSQPHKVYSEHVSEYRGLARQLSAEMRQLSQSVSTLVAASADDLPTALLSLFEIIERATSIEGRCIDLHVRTLLMLASTD